MTDDEITERLATDLLGWRPVSADLRLPGWLRPDSVRVWRRDFAPLTDARACALVLDEIERRGWRRVMLGVGQANHFYIRNGNDRVLGWAESNSWMRALCVAALRAVGVS
jgi:hypothetical protein